MTRTKLLMSIRAPLMMLAVLLLLCGPAFSGTARAQEGAKTIPCVSGLELPAELAELDLASLQAALQAMVEEDSEATVTLPSDLYGGEETATIRADLLLADEAVLAALLEGQPVDVAVLFPEAEGDEVVIVAIEVSTTDGCTSPPFCFFGIELPAALAELDVTGLRAALEEMLSEDADATLTVGFDERPAVVRADLLSGLDDAVLEALLVGEPLMVTVDAQSGSEEIVGLRLPEGTECSKPRRPPEPEPGDVQDDQQGGARPTVPDNQQTGGKDTGTGKTPDNQQGGDGDTATKTFRLTINGTVPDGQVFGVIYGTSDDPEAFNQIIFCGQFPTGPDTATREPDCRGGGTVYEERVTLARGTGIIFVYFRSTEEVPEGPEDFVFEQFHTGEEVLQGDLVNTAWYTYGSADGDKPVPDNQLAGEDKDTGTGDDQQVPDNQQGSEDAGEGDDVPVPDNQKDGIQEDQQGEIPEEMPETGAGGLASGAPFLVGNAAAGLTMLLGTGYSVIRRR